jgi:hypothetical protein
MRGVVNTEDPFLRWSKEHESMKGTFRASMTPCLLVALARHGQGRGSNTAFRDGAPPDKSAFGFEVLNSACVLAPA